MIIIGVIAISVMMFLGLWAQLYAQRETFEVRVRAKRNQLAKIGEMGDVQAVIRHDDVFARLGVSVVHVICAFAWVIAASLAEFSTMLPAHERIAWIIALSALVVSAGFMGSLVLVAWMVKERRGKYRVTRTGAIQIISDDEATAPVRTAARHRA